MRRTYRRRLSRKGKLLLFLVGFLWFIGWILGRLGPMVQAAAETAAARQVEEVLHEAVQAYAQWAGENDGFVAISRGEEGNILSLEQDTAAMARVQSFVSNFVQEKLSGTGGTVWVPVGSLTGISLLYGCGPGIPLSVTTVGSCQASCDSTFSQAGVNQTLHRVTLQVTCHIWVQLPGWGFSEEWEEEMVLSETVIVGEVPSALFTQGAS